MENRKKTICGFLLTFSIFAACATTLVACGKKTEEMDPWIVVPVEDTEPAFIRAMLKENISSREYPKEDARFVLSTNRDTKTKNELRFRSEIIESKSGCVYVVTYQSKQQFKLASAQELPGTPGADKELLSAKAPAFSLQTRSPQCATAAMRQDLAKARALARKSQESKENKSFANAARELDAAIAAKGDASVATRFVLTGSSSLDESKGFVLPGSTSSGDKGQGLTNLYELIERQTGCVWKVARPASGKGLLRPVSIEPPNCAEDSEPFVSESASR